MASERLQVVLELVTGAYQRGAREAATATEQLSKQTKNAGEATNFASRTFQKWGDEIKTFIALRAARAIKDFALESIEAARNLNESQNAVNQVFKESADTIFAFGQISAQAAGLSTREFNELATVTGALLTNLGLGFDEAAEQSIRLTTRAGDLASVFDKDVSTALEAINSSLQGQQKPLRQFGINLSDAEIRAKAVELGLAKTTAEVDKHGKAVATLELIYEQSDAAAGDFLRTSEELANSQRRAAANFENAQARLGQSAQAPLAALADFAATTLDSFTALGLFGEAEAHVAQQSLRMKEAVSLITDALKASENPALAFQDALLHMATNGELTTGAFEALAGAAGVVVEDTDVFAESLAQLAREAGVSEEVIDELVGAITGTGDAAGGAAGSLDEFADEAEDVAEETRTAAEAVRDLTLAFFEAANPIFAAQGALDRYERAQANLDETRADTESTARDIAAAELEVAKAALEAESALLELGSGSINEGIGAIADALGKSEDEARELLEVLGILDGTQVTSVVTTDFRTRGAPPPMLSTSGFTTRVGTAGVRHTGGHVDAGRPYVWRPGDEMFIPQQDGLITSKADTTRLIEALAGSESGGSRTVLHIGNVYGWEDFVEKVNKAGVDINRMGWN